jgi:hypothetical protein
MAYLPDLIRDGVEVTDKGKGKYTDTSVSKACAIGAAAVGVEGKEAPRWTIDSTADRILDGLDKHRVSREEAPHMYIERVDDYLCNFPISLSSAVIRANDTLGMKREEIADWLDETFDEDTLTLGV